MAYCTQSDLEKRIGSADLTALSDYDDDDSPDADVVAAAIASADALIDSYLGTRLSVPVQMADGSTPDAVKSRSVSLAVYHLKMGRDSVTADARAQYEDDVAWLAKVAAGQVSLGSDESPAESGRAPSVEYESQDRLFGRDEPL